MSRTGTDPTRCVKADRNFIAIRSSLDMHWSAAPVFTLDEAEDVADYIKTAVDKSRRDSPEIRAFASDLADAETADRSWEDIALELYRKGYRKQ